MPKLPEQYEVAAATDQHAADIRKIYQMVKINPQVFIDLASTDSRRSTTARELIKSRGGFLSPPDDMDMELSLEHGSALVALSKGQVAGFNRCVTDPETVQKLFFAEFQLDVSKAYTKPEHLTDWVGKHLLKPYKTLNHVFWIDKNQAILALGAIAAGLQNQVGGKLAWALDAAVHPDNQHAGISRTLIAHLTQNLTPGFALRAFRMFDIRKVNGIEIVLDNDASKRAFVSAETTLFAYTEEDIRINKDINITVRWNQWLRHSSIQG
jgi:hypothetical protein